MKYVHTIAFILLIIGGLNWGLTALGFNAVNILLGTWPEVERLAYILVGISAVYIGISHAKDCTTCSTGTKAM